MASISPTAWVSQQVTPNHEISGKVWFTKEELDQPYDVTWIESRMATFKAPKKVLSEASSFFEKLLNSDLKESKEGVVRLEMFTDSVMRSTSEFIYTGNIQILDDDTRDLVMIADYLFLQRLNTLAAHILILKLNISHCVSIFHFADEYHCEELASRAKTFTLAIFSAMFSVNSGYVLKMSSYELSMLISSDELHVSI